MPRSGAHHVVTAALTLAGGAAGYVVAAWSATLLTNTSDGINTAFLTLALAGAGFLIGNALRHHTHAAYQRLLTRLERIPSEAVISAVLGASIGLTIAVMLNTVLAQVPGYTWWHNLVTGLTSLVVCVELTVRHRAVLTDNKPAKATPVDLLLDTSAIIDGRIQTVLPHSLPHDAVGVSTRVLDELQALADSPKPDRRARGTRGLSNLERLKADGVRVTTVRDDMPASLATDAALAELAVKHQATLLTVDYDLTRAARLRGADVINLNELAHALRPHYGIGDKVLVHLDGPGNEPDQAVGTLPDGTLVVLKRGAPHIGRTRHVRIQNVLDRPTGRILFAEDAGPTNDQAQTGKNDAERGA